MLLNLSHIWQIGLAVSDVDRAEKFYETVIGLRKLYRFGDLTFFDGAGVRLLLEKTRNGSQPRQGSVKPTELRKTLELLGCDGVFSRDGVHSAHHHPNPHGVAAQNLVASSSVESGRRIGRSASSAVR
jgi:catechol 2,3-dioxygenase-like lactoylglutathione lyase family enzyme